MSQTSAHATVVPRPPAVGDAMDLLGITPRVDGRLTNGGVVVGPTLVSDISGPRLGTARTGVMVDYAPDEPIGATGVGSFMSQLEEGDFLALAWGASVTASCCGGLAARYAASQGCVGFVTDGWVRDVDDLTAAQLGVWARGTTPITGKGRVRLQRPAGPVRIGGVDISEGDTIVADRTGICVVPRGVADKVLDLARELEQKETTFVDVLASGSTFDEAAHESGTS